MVSYLEKHTKNIYLYIPNKLLLLFYLYYCIGSNEIASNFIFFLNKFNKILAIKRLFLPPKFSLFCSKIWHFSSKIWRKKYLKKQAALLFIKIKPNVCVCGTRRIFNKKRRHSKLGRWDPREPMATENGVRQRGNVRNKNL